MLVAYLLAQYHPYQLPQTTLALFTIKGPKPVFALVMAEVRPLLCQLFTSMPYLVLYRSRSVRPSRRAS